VLSHLDLTSAVSTAQAPRQAGSGRHACPFVPSASSYTAPPPAPSPVVVFRSTLESPKSPPNPPYEIQLVTPMILVYPSSLFWAIFSLILVMFGWYMLVLVVAIVFNTSKLTHKKLTPMTGTIFF
jgi:hypothetical protein